MSMKPNQAMYVPGINLKDIQLFAFKNNQPFVSNHV